MCCKYVAVLVLTSLLLSLLLLAYVNPKMDERMGPKRDRFAMKVIERYLFDEICAVLVLLGYTVLVHLHDTPEISKKLATLVVVVYFGLMLRNTHFHYSPQWTIFIGGAVIGFFTIITMPVVVFTIYNNR